MYSLDSKYYKKEFPTIDQLIEHVISSGMDPNNAITFNGETTGEWATDFIEDLTGIE